jgi:hypothetical protein
MTDATADEMLPLARPAHTRVALLIRGDLEINLVVPLAIPAHPVEVLDVEYAENAVVAVDHDEHVNELRDTDAGCGEGLRWLPQRDGPRLRR